MVTKLDSGEPCGLDPKEPAEQDKSRYERVLNERNMEYLNTEDW
jgi:hypothetical protein